MSSSSAFFRHIAPVFLVISLFVLYLFSMAPGFSWAHDGADGGDLITAAATGGVAHPSGYPTFLLLARLFQLLPLGTIAYRTNLMSAAFTALTALLIYDIVVSSPRSPAKGIRLAGLIAGYAYGLSALAWSQATITEVYGLHIFFVTLVIWLLVGRFAYSPNKLRLDAVIGLSIGLGIGNHLTSAALLPTALLVGIVMPLSLDTKKDTRKTNLKKKETKREDVQFSIDWPSLGRRCGWVFAGLLVYALIFLWASSHAPVNWGYAVNPANLWWLVSGAFYQRYAFSQPIGEAFLRLVTVAQLLLTQFGVLGLLTGFFTFFRNLSPSRLLLVSGWVALANVIFSIGYASTDSYIYLLPFFLVFAIWIGLGVGNINGLLAGQKSWINLGVSVILLVSLWGMAFMNYPKIDLSGDHRSENFEKALAAKLPQQAIVLAKGDQALFSLWYYHFVLKERPDIIILGDGVLSSQWYIDILHDTYPTLNLSLENVLSQQIAQANPTRPTCSVLIVNDRMILDCYRSVSEGANTSPFISINQSIEK